MLGIRRASEEHNIEQKITGQEDGPDRLEMGSGASGDKIFTLPIFPVAGSG